MSYATVRLGRLNANGPATYSFPTTKAAEKFGKSHHAMYPGRTIVVKNTLGKTIRTYKSKALKKKDAA